MSDLDDFDAAIEASVPERTSTDEIDSRVYTGDVVQRIARGDSIRELALELGVSEASIRNRLRKAPLKDLVAIESRRIMRHLPRRDLKKVPYKDLVFSAAKFLEVEKGLRDGEMARQDRAIDKTTVNQILVLVQGQGSVRGSTEESGSISKLAIDVLPPLPELPDPGTEGGDPSGSVGGGES